jgi:hypothetical protein
MGCSSTGQCCTRPTCAPVQPIVWCLQRYMLNVLPYVWLACTRFLCPPALQHALDSPPPRARVAGGVAESSPANHAHCSSPTPASLLSADSKVPRSHTTIRTRHSKKLPHAHSPTQCPVQHSYTVSCATQIEFKFLIVQVHATSRANTSCHCFNAAIRMPCSAPAQQQPLVLIVLLPTRQTYRNSRSTPCGAHACLPLPVDQQAPA